MGAAAIDALLSGQCDIMIGADKNQIVQIPLETAIGQEKKTPLDLVLLSNMLAT